MTIKLEDAINSITKETPLPTSYFQSSIKFNLHIAMESNLGIMYKLPSVHKKCKKTNNVIFECRQTPQCQILEPQNLTFPRLQCHY